MEMAKAEGPLVIIGGAEDKDGDCKILREFVRLAGGRDARIAILTAATGSPERVGDRYIEVFERLGAADSQVIDTRDKRDAEEVREMDFVNQATGFFFTGGDQSRIIGAMKDTRLDEAIRKRHAEGAVVGGTSAGAAMMPTMMIVEGDAETNPRLEIVEMAEGMGFLPGVVIDQHFAQRGRLGRLLSALLTQPVALGIGIDEDTAIMVQDDELMVIGNGAVTIVDESTSTHNNVATALRDEDLAICDVKLHILPAGYRFNLTHRQPIPVETPLSPIAA